MKGNTIKRHHANIHKVLLYAVDMEYMDRNPASRLSLPKKERFVGAIYTPEQLAHLFEITKGTAIEAPVFLAATNGLRRSEVMGLKWSTVDFKAKRLFIQHTVVGNGAQHIMSDGCKTISSERELPMIENVENYQLELMQHHEKMKEILCKGYTPNDYICRWDDGRQMKPDYVSIAFRKQLVMKGLPVIRFHYLRHSVASILVSQANNLKQVSDFIGLVIETVSKAIETRRIKWYSF